MMDYEHQPANHLSFRLASRVVVPSIFPESALRRFGAPPGKTVRFPGFKEELYLADFQPDSTILSKLGLDHSRVIAVLRPPPEGALYHRKHNERFDEVLRVAVGCEDVQTVLLPRTREQGERYRILSNHLWIPQGAIDARSLLALADLVIGAGGTMNRESAILGTPTYTVFGGRLAAVDVELIRSGRLIDLRAPGREPRFERKASGREPIADPAPILAAIVSALEAVAEDSR
jgi:predicted glycosyltransferase